MAAHFAVPIKMVRRLIREVKVKNGKNGDLQPKTDKNLRCAMTTAVVKWSTAAILSSTLQD